ncbi:MAG: SpoIIE family protein phosphatase, partial [Kangiellaceae bacterium]
LPAAIGALPTSEIFYGMSKKGFSLEDLVKETNTRLYNILPRGVFCCCVIADIDPQDKQMKFWSAGAPDAYFIDKKKEEVTLLHSSHLPLGILSPNAFNAKFQSYEFTEHHKLLTATDGIIESPDVNDQMYGEKRMLDYIQQHVCADNICDGLLEEVEAYIGLGEQDDDLSLLEVSFPDTLQTTQLSATTDQNKTRGTADSEFKLRLRGQSLSEFDPIPLFLQTILECNELLPHRTRIFTVLTELYNNALDHGVLGLDSKLKTSSTGFAQYYQQRAEGLTALTDDFVEISVDHQPTEKGGKLIFILSDSGKGFDVDKIINRGSQDYSGRGLPLLLQLCTSIDYFDNGTKVKAVYEWHEDMVPE